MSFKKTTFCLALSLASLVSASVIAADGTVNFKGKISDAPCSVSIPSSNQDVQLGTVPAADLNASGLKSPQKSFQIDLLNCSAAAKSVTVTFGGSSPVANPALFNVSSSTGMAASNVGIEITDSKGVDIKPNVASSTISLTPSIASQSLFFTANYQSYGIATVGDADATSDFTLTYQ